MPPPSLSFITAAASHSSKASDNGSPSQIEREMLAALLAPWPHPRTFSALHCSLKPFCNPPEFLEPVEGLDPRD